MADTSEEGQDSAVGPASASASPAGAGEGDSEGGGAAANNAEADAPQFLSVNYDSDPLKREIGGEAVWTLSSAKSGNGVDQLRDNSIHTFWQSDGTQPHHVNIQFLRKKSVCALSFYLEHKLDESYTPKVDACCARGGDQSRSFRGCGGWRGLRERGRALGVQTAGAHVFAGLSVRACLRERAFVRARFVSGERRRAVRPPAGHPACAFNAGDGSSSPPPPWLALA